MRGSPRVIVVMALAGVLALAAVPPAFAGPPENDSYLRSILLAPLGMPERPARHLELSVDTSEATVQPDLFDPDKEGQPLGGEGPEPTDCNGVAYGKTVWYDVHPDVTGAAQMTATGFDSVIAVYRYDGANSKLIGRVACQNTGTGKSLTLAAPGPVLQRGKAYTIQIGGVGNAGGPLAFTWDFFPDGDADGVLDEVPDQCPNIKGPDSDSGCPPRLAPTVTLSSTNGSIRVTGLSVANLPKGSRVSVRCRRCGLSTRMTVRRSKKPVTVRGAVGRSVPKGAVFDLVATHPKTRSGRFRYGAIGAHRRWVARGGKLVGPTQRCLLPSSTKPRRTCR